MIEISDVHSSGQEKNVHSLKRGKIEKIVRLFNILQYETAKRYSVRRFAMVLSYSLKNILYNSLQTIL